MKKIITLVAIGLALISFTPQAQAQTERSVTSQEIKINKEEITKEAKMEVAELAENLELSEEQEKMAIKKYFSYKLNYKKHLGEGVVKDRAYMNNKMKFDQSLIAEMKSILNKDQFQAYEKMMKEKM